MKKTLKWVGIVLISPVVLFIILTVLLYLPPIQNWVAQQVASYASKETGMHLRVGHVSLGFPLDLTIDHLLVIQPKGTTRLSTLFSPLSVFGAPSGSAPSLSEELSAHLDTIADIRQAVANVQFWPLLKGEIVLDELTLRDAKLHTIDFIDDMRMKGTIGELTLSVPVLDTEKMDVVLRQPRISDTDLTVFMSDTAAIDTSTVGWNIRFDRFSLQRTRLTIVSDSAAHFGHDAARITAYMGDASLCLGDIDLGLGRYALGNVSWQEGKLNYGDMMAMSDVNLKIDSLFSYGDQLRVSISEGSLREDSTGLELTQLQGGVAMDGEGLRVNSLQIGTPHSSINADVLLASSLNSPANSSSPSSPGGHIRINASIGKDDAARLAPDMATLMPDLPLTLHAQVDGNGGNMEVHQLSVSLPTIFTAEATGTVANLLDENRRQAQLQLKANAYNLDPLLHRFGLPSDYRIPAGLSLNGNVNVTPNRNANGSRYGADLTLRDGAATSRVKGECIVRNGQFSTFNGQCSMANVDLSRYMPGQQMGPLTAEVQLSGSGTDILTPGNNLQADIRLQSLRYGQHLIDSVNATATIDGTHALLSAKAHNALIKGNIDVDAILENNTIDATINASLPHINLPALGVSDAPVVGMNGKIILKTDQRQSHYLTAHLTELTLSDSVKTRHPKDLGLLFHTNADTTRVRLQSGDLIVKFDAPSNYQQLLADFQELADTAIAQNRRHIIDQPVLKSMLPTASLTVTSQQGNPLSDVLLASAGISFKSLDAKLSSSSATGLNGDAYLLGFRQGDMLIDTIRVSLVDKVTRQSFNGQVTNNRRNPNGPMNILFDGQLRDHGARMGVRYYDAQGRENVRIGAEAAISNDGLRLTLMPANPVLACKTFTLNDDNYILLQNDKRLLMNIDLRADDGTHILAYSSLPSSSPSEDGTADLPSDSNATTATSEAEEGSDYLQDFTVSVHQLNLGDLTGNLPLLPNISGILEGDFHLLMDQEHSISVASDMHIDRMAYEGSTIGNLGSEFVYLLREDGTHVVDGTLMLDENPIGSLQGSYMENGLLDASLTLESMPLSIVNGFMPDQLLGFEGEANGTLSMKGKVDKLDMDGQLTFNNGYLVSNPYGMRLRFGDKPLQMLDTKLLFDHFTLYAYNENPMSIDGSVDMSGQANGDDAVSLRLGARNFQLINAKQKKESVAYGRMFVNFFARLTGNLDKLKLRGMLDVMGTTDLNYILLDSPLSTVSQMDELVHFTDFNDTIPAVVQRPASDAFDVDMQISIDQGANVRCALDAEQNNYVNLMGGGNLRMLMGDHGLQLRGRYTVEYGSMKYSLPIIPLKTFTIKQGSYVEFTGEPDNPTLNITATERYRTTVATADGQNRSVNFDCGVVITRTLSDMGLQFIIDAPEDIQMQSELGAMGTEQRGKIAVTMLTTGMYLADGNTGSFSMNSALSSFLQKEIDNLTSGALKTVDLQLGLDNSTDASGQTHTDYSFRFSKRFWNNRLSVQIGGKVSSGTEIEGQQQSFFDNVTMEYRLSPTSNQYVKLFYRQNVYDWLEGYTSEYGGGFVWKRKLDKLTDLFKKTPQPTPIRREGRLLRTPGSHSPTDTIQHSDTIHRPDTIHINEPIQ
jgi:hypothetical protein